MNIAVLIPAYNPGEILLDLLQQLSTSDVTRIIVVNDGSAPVHQSIFERLQSIPKIELLIHAQNQGKGAALKTGLRFLAGLTEPVGGVVTADADGQHAVEDILTIARHTLVHPDALTLGGRRFDKDVPWKSMIGNTISRWVTRAFGVWIYDTQTGLRGIPEALIPCFMDLPYDRFEYEQEMLMVCSRQSIPVEEVTIRTIYFNQNRATHFHPFKDSVRVFFVIFRYRLTWLFTWLADLLFFFLVAQLTSQILLATLAARLAALIFIYPFLSSLVFPSQDDLSRVNLRSYFHRLILLALSLGLVSALAVSLLQAQVDWSLLRTKVLVEITLLFLFALLPKGLKRAILQE